MEPLVFEVGPFSLHAYTVCVVGAVVLCGWLTYREADRRGRLTEETLVVGSVGLLCGVIGAKLSMLVFLGPSEFWRLLSTIPSHGAAFTGALIGGYAGVVLSERILGVRQCTGDIVAPFIPLGQAIGRLGNFLAADAYGTPTSLPWGVHQAGAVRHPAALYEMVLDLILFGFLWKRRLTSFRDGELFSMYVAGYALIRFPLEFVRYQPTPRDILGLTLVQWFCVAAIIGVGTHFYIQHKGVKCVCDLLPKFRRRESAA